MLKPSDPLLTYVLRLADTPLILSQRLCEWCGHAPELEIDLALSNIGLDLLGQARNFLAYASELAGEGFDEDRLAFTRDTEQFHNVLLVEQPNGGFNDTLVRQFFMDNYHVLLYRELVQSNDSRLAAIAAKSLKESEYHLRFSRGWIIRLGDGTDISHHKIAQSLNALWRFTGELFYADELETTLAQCGVGVDPGSLKEAWYKQVAETLRQATLQLPDESPYRQGGKQGQHTEHLGYMLAEMQFLQRAYPGCQW